MRTVILGERPPALDAYLEERRRNGLDTHDEVWNGEYHMAPAAHPRHGFVQMELLAALRDHARRCGLVATAEINVGTSEKDYRVPDGAVLDELPPDTFVPTALIVVEVLSPHDETFEKFAFYHARDVREIIVADPEARVVDVYQRADVPRYVRTASSGVLGVDARALTDAVAWP